MNYIKKSIPIFLITINLFSQFTEVKISLNKDRLQKSINNELDHFETTIQNYILNSDYASDAMDIDFYIELLFVFEGMSEKGSQKIFNTQILATNGIDQQFFSKGVEFSYYPGQSFFYNSPSYNYARSLERNG